MKKLKNLTFYQIIRMLANPKTAEQIIEFAQINNNYIIVEKFANEISDMIEWKGDCYFELYAFRICKEMNVWMHNVTNNLTLLLKNYYKSGISFGMYHDMYRIADRKDLYKQLD